MRAKLSGENTLKRSPNKKQTNAKSGKIDFSDIPELDRKFWKRAEVVLPKTKKAISLRVDPDVLAWFQARGKGYQSLINAVLRSYVESAAGKVRRN